MVAASSLIDSRHELLQRVVDARRRSDEVFDIVRPESLYERPIPERHRIVFYIGHLEAFDWNLLRERLIDRRAFHPEFDRLFAFGIDPVGGGLPTDQASDWPSIEAVRDYVRQVRQSVDSALADIGFDDDHRYEFSPSLLLNVAIEHRLMHAETLAYMLHQLSLEHKIRPARTPQPVSRPVQTSMIHIPAGSVTLGLSRADRNAFGWDNEFEAQMQDVPAFEIDKYKVTNGQYLEFVNAGGYSQRALWSEADWQWRTQQGIRHPAFWKMRDHQWRYRTMFDEIPLPLDWPVYVSHAEASAYASWAGKSLPTEAQWQRAVYGASQAREHIRS
jgi:gamma-glutamyl hercynylcysteine S-oxide synthase